MGGMLTKEFLYIRRRQRWYLLGLVIAVLCLMPSSSNYAKPVLLLSNIAGFAGMWTTVPAISVMANDEKAKWDAFARSLPLHIRTIVGVKYVISIICTAAAIGVVFLASLFLQVDAETQAAACLGCAAFSLALCAVLLPLTFRFGSQKGLLIYFGLLFLLLPVILLLKKSNFAITTAYALRLIQNSLLIVSALLAASFFISCRIYSHKEI